ncbi:Glycosyltransferase 2-like domain-containing protein [Psychrobacter okhotskensis]|uniref:glycosyltransferase family 2 protein n=1 Tax=Psychrobacter okhotskensis TaxID=212403 RepID=UPI003F579AB2
MNESTYVTIGIPFYNAEKYLEGAICSVLAQTHTSWELILVDDGSTDQSLEIAKAYAKKENRIKVLSDDRNKKLASRLNQIIDEAKYDFIARMDADDLMSSSRLQKQIHYLHQNLNIDLVSTGVLSLDNNLTLVGYRNTPSNKIITKVDAIVGSTGIIHASILARKSWYERNRYNENSFLAQDYELWLNAFINNDLKAGFIEEQLYYYREEQNITLEKILKAHNTQIKTINHLSNNFLSLSEKLKYISKIKAKSIVAKGLFLFSLDSLLHKRRVQTENIEELETLLNNELSLINGEKRI